MRTHWSEDSIDYDGSQLRAHWILARFGLVGDACVGFRGACNVVTDEIADLEDLDGPGIAANDMVHFVWETFTSCDLLLAVHRQRLFAACAGELLQRMSGVPLRREGDDLYLGDGKLSISIATASPVSALLHFAVNATPGGAPVPIATLADLDVDPEAFGRALLAAVADEQESIHAARAKVRSKGEWLPGGRS
ncbi:MAG: DUF366 family protein [Planctomycetes bacterium]|nr:DUF366 family protein [Planctomycetota bacterium]MCB9887202.1 DUF366 family protein [Planctomycetota bacterium]